MNAPKAQAIKKSRRGLVGWVAGGVVTALVVTLAVVASGFDSRETPREDPSVWVERMAGQYARVNTETAEIDTVRTAPGTQTPYAQTSVADVLHIQDHLPPSALIGLVRRLP